MHRKWALFFSGKGSNLEAVLEKYHLTWKVPPVVVTNNPKALGCKVASRFKLQPIILEKPIDYDLLSATLKEQNVELIFLLGYLKILPASFINNWAETIFNLHPSLLPKYPGLLSIEKAWTDKKNIGVSIHRVTEGVDQGAILLQQLVLKPKDYDHLSLEEVIALVHSKEHQIVCDFIPLGEKNIV